MIRVQQEDFNIGEEIRNLTEGHYEVGAVVTFTGLVRDMAKGEAISEMELEHYPGMTEKELERIEQIARDRWPLTGTLIIHRYGKLKPGDNIVLVITTSAHRQASFDSAAFLMDYLKTNATFWKRETSANGGEWVDARETDLDMLDRWNIPASSK
ncbi:MAG: molybdopterin synthase catalytic subunit MoaE [Methyloligellaceae bacterium]